MKNKLKYILFLFLLVSSKVYSQYVPIEEQKAKLIWELQKYMTWENDQYIDEIILGTYDCPPSMLKALERYKPSKFATGVDYKIINFHSLNDLRYCHIFYLPEDKNYLAKDIFRFYQAFPTVIITDGWYNKEQLMINLFVEASGQQVNFEYNMENIINHGISLMPGFDQLGGIDLNAKKLLQQTRKELAKIENQLKQKEAELNEKLREVELQKKRIEEQNRYIRQQERIIAQRQAEIVKQKQRLQKLYKELMTYQAQLDMQVQKLQQKEREVQLAQRKLEQSQKLLLEAQQRYQKQKALLDKQQQKMKLIEQEVKKKQRQLQKLNFTITLQRLVIAVFFVMLVIIAILSYFIYRSYKVQKQQNILLQQQKEKIQAQAEQLEKLSIVASETSNAVSIINPDGTFEWINEGFRKVYGYNIDDLINEYGGLVIKFNPLLKNAITEVIDRKTSVTTESLIYKKNGKPIWVQSTITPIFHNGDLQKIIIIDSDITRIKEAEAEIRRKNDQIMQQARELEQKNFELAKLSIVAENTDNGVIIADHTGKIEWVNAGLERMLDMSFEEFKQYYGDNIIFADLDGQTLGYIEQALKKGESAEYTFKLTTPSGKLLWLRSTLTPMFDDNGYLLKLFSINADITELKLAQEKIEKQNRDIRKSIQYAQRIQQAALPPQDYIASLLPEYFILYLPKDIVSGDFYWMTKVRDKILFTAADCTGHGVPGAFMSMLGIAFLNEIVGKIEYDQLQPNLILNILREYVIRFLKQEEKTGSSKDGMDMALCMLDTSTNELHFAGANNPAWIVRDNQLIELKGDDMPIGIYYNAKESFTNQVISYQQGDIVYLFSDGYADQFGGPRGKKFMVKRFRKLILEISSEDMEQQKALLLQTFRDWKGNRRQLDDILVMGVKL